MPSHPADELRRKGERPAPPFPPDHPVTPDPLDRGGNPDAAFDEGVLPGNGVHPPHQPSRPPIERRR